MVYIYESVEAGFGTQAEEASRYSTDLESLLMEHSAQSIFVRVKGDSMRDVGIFPGDMVVVDSGKTPKLGDIIIAKIDGRYTLKFYQKDATGKVFLQSGNTKYENMYPQESLELLGVIVSLIRRY